MMRDHSLFYPWFARDADHRLQLDMPSADALHEATVELLKGFRTFHFSFRAAFRYPPRERLMSGEAKAASPRKYRRKSLSL